MSINWQQYPIVAFIDSNIALECSALDGIPWKEISATGPILVLVVPTVMQEVDSKKNHARLADHARRFNRTLRPLLEGEATVLVRESPAPRVEIALADCIPVDWEQYPELDRDEPDARVVAQALSAQGPSPDSRVVVVSQDIRPLHLARRHGLNIHQVSETWLRPKEVSEAEKRAASLQRQLDAMKDREPLLALHLSTSQPSVDVYRIKALAPEERQAIQENIIRLSPMPVQKHSGLTSIMGDYDHTLDERYTKWERNKVNRPGF
jgi:predicted ribonuclease YlaK